MAIGKKYGGRKKGTPNRKTSDILNRAERILRLLETQHLEKDIKRIAPAKRIDLHNEMMEYVLPKLSRQEINVTPSKIKIEIVRIENDTPAPKEIAQGPEDGNTE